MKKNNKTIAKETIDILEHGYTTTKRIHQGYKEYDDAKKKTDVDLFKKYKIELYFGKWQYIFIKGDMKISLVKLKEILFNSNKNEKTRWYWEIYAHEDKRLFTGCKRHPTKITAMVEVERLLGE